MEVDSHPEFFRHQYFIPGNWNDGVSRTVFTAGRIECLDPGRKQRIKWSDSEAQACDSKLRNPQEETSDWLLIKGDVYGQTNGLYCIITDRILVHHDRHSRARTYCQWNAKRRHVGGFRSASMAPSLQHFQAWSKPAGHVMVRNSSWSLNTVRDCHTTATRLDVIYFRLLLNRERDVYRHRMVFQRPVSRHTATT